MDAVPLQASTPTMRREVNKTSAQNLIEVDSGNLLMDISPVLLKGKNKICRKYIMENAFQKKGPTPSVQISLSEHVHGVCKHNFVISYTLVTIDDEILNMIITVLIYATKFIFDEVMLSE